jgi:hypothetical protein
MRRSLMICHFVLSRRLRGNGKAGFANAKGAAS